MTNPATKVIELCGGHRNVSLICEVDVSRVYRWTYERERGGTGGLIPAKYQVVLLREGRSRGFSLEPADFFIPVADVDPQARSGPNACRDGPRKTGRERPEGRT